MGSVKDLEKYLFDKIETIKLQALLLDYIKGPKEVETILQLESDLASIQNFIGELKDLVKKQDERILELKATNDRILNLNRVISDQLANKHDKSLTPVIQSAMGVENIQSNTTATRPNCESNKKLTLIPRKACYLTPDDLSSDEESVQIPTFEDIKKKSPHFCFYEIEYITPKEFSSIPKYMKDEKTTLERLNWAIDELNKARDKKYAIIATAKANLNERIRCAIREYKDQEIKATQKTPFIVEKDLNEFTNFRLDKSGHKFMTIFRHCKRIKEVRGNNLTRYVFL